jgi:integrase
VALCACKGGHRLTTTYIDGDQLELVLALLTPPNRMACQLALHTGLRIGDVLALRADQLRPRLTIRESKTGKSRRITIPAKLLASIREQAGDVWAWPGRDPSKHRTRQAVWADVKRAQRALRLPQSIGPHSLRKTYAVRQYARSGDLGKVQAALNHSDMAVTMLYAMADHLTRQRAAGGTRRRSKPR